MTLICLHCRRSCRRKARGLCWPCYYTPEVRRLYASRRGDAWHGLPDRQPGESPAPAAGPTSALPGSAAKIAALAERAARGEELFHGEDGR